MKGGNKKGRKVGIKEGTWKVLEGNEEEEEM